MLVRDARLEDMPAVQALYAHHVLHGAASFEEAAPDLAEITARWRGVLARGLPWLAAEHKGAIVGYAYAHPYRDRSAWRPTLEDSVYVAHDCARRGAGRALLGALIERCSAAGYAQMIAVIGDSRNAGSIGLHAALGFRHVGVFEGVGVKFGRTLDVVLMQRAL
ncbi:MAG: family acetyltransferase [Hyphomicrobiales bacterium]|nr:family acetyltransferase [Hyphomicrobiales bacterium]